MAEEIRYPSVEQISRMYRRVVETTGGEHGYLSKSNLEYFLDTVKDVGERLPRRQAIVKKAAFLLYNVIITHPFLNGNKRTAFEMSKSFLAFNGYRIDPEAKAAYKFLLSVASGDASVSEVEDWVARNLTESKSE